MTEFEQIFQELRALRADIRHLARAQEHTLQEINLLRGIIEERILAAVRRITGQEQ